jgi:basic amino acid/polyamine antiporter, APA family
MTSVPTQDSVVIAPTTEPVRLSAPSGAGALQRSLGLGSLTFYGVGVILGAGIYSILGEAAGVAGEALWWSFLLASLAALLTGLSYAELATMFPLAGAEYVYLRAAWPRASWLPGTLGWVLVVTGIATAATVALAFAGYASLFTSLPLWMIAVALVVAMGALNALGVNEASWANIVFTLVEAAGLVALIVVGARDPDFGRVFTTAPHAGVLGGAALIFFAYLGFEEIANLAEEAIHPGRDLPRAILIAVAVSTTLYILVAAASVTLLAPAQLAASASPLADAMQVGAPHLSGALAGVALFATANTALIAMMAASRLLFAMARGGDAPSLLARTLARRKTPAAAILLVMAGALVCLPLGGVELVGSIASLLALVTFASVNAALVRLRFTHPETSRPFRVPLSLRRVPVPALLGLFVVVLLLTGFQPVVYGIAVAVLVLAFIVQAIPWNQDFAPGASQR